MDNYEDKVFKNIQIGLGIWTTMKNKKSVGVINKLVKFYSFEDIIQGFEDSKKGIAIKSILRMS